MRKLSVGLRLTLWYLAIFAGGQLVFGSGMWFILRHNLYNIMDETLAGQIQDVKRFLDSQKPRNQSVPKLREEFDETYSLERQGDYLQVFDDQGALIYRASFLQEHELAHADPLRLRGPVFEDREIGGEVFRFLSQTVEVRGHRFLVQAGLPTRQMLATLLLFQRGLFMVTPLMLAIAAGVGHWLSSRALAPVDALTRTARTISSSNLSSRLEKLNTGDELQRLSDTLNDMLERIESAFVRVTEFTADASHELRTPVSVIRTEAEIALRRSRSQEDYRDALRHILLKAENTSALVERLLSLARADSGRETLHMRRCDLRAAIVEIADEWRPLAEARNLDFRVTVADGEIMVSADLGAMQRLLAILLDNAVRYTRAPGLIELSLAERQGSAVIRVCDSGIGISNQDQARIFERFYRAENARNHGTEGAGLGLAIAHWIVQQHHGSLTVQSRLSEGSVFTIELPVPEEVFVDGSPRHLAALHP
jgi:two-component system, OmpR family, heavy metal sensor histidine kinase CusS